MTTQAPNTPASVGRTVTTTPDDTSIVMTRSFMAPRALVFDLWTDPKLIPDFWGPAIHVNEVKVWDFRVGGKWQIMTATPDGGTVDFHGEFVWIERPAIIEWTFGFDSVPPGPETLFIDEVEGVTTMRSVSTMPSREVRDMVLQGGMEAGAAEMHDCFEAILTQRLGI